MSDRVHELLWPLGLAIGGCLAFIFGVGAVDLGDALPALVIVCAMAFAWEFHVHHPHGHG